MKLVYQCIAIFFNFYTTSNHLHSLQVENCDSNSRLVVDEDDNGKFRTERVNRNIITILFIYLCTAIRSAYVVGHPHAQHGQCFEEWGLS